LNGGADAEKMDFEVDCCQSAPSVELRCCKGTKSGTGEWITKDGHYWDCTNHHGEAKDKTVEAMGECTEVETSKCDEVTTDSVVEGKKRPILAKGLDCVVKTAECKYLKAKTETAEAAETEPAEAAETEPAEAAETETAEAAKTETAEAGTGGAPAEGAKK